jgi:hypothetical protein
MPIRFQNDGIENFNVQRSRSGLIQFIYLTKGKRQNHLQLRELKAFRTKRRKKSLLYNPQKS